MAEYRIQEKTMTAIADRTRRMAGTSTPLTPSEIIVWLARVMYIPQGWAHSGELTLSIIAGASGINCSFEHGYAACALSSSRINITTAAVGTLLDETEE